MTRSQPGPSTTCTVLCRPPAPTQPILCAQEPARLWGLGFPLPSPWAQIPVTRKLVCWGLARCSGDSRWHWEEQLCPRVAWVTWKREQFHLLRVACEAGRSRAGARAQLGPAEDMCALPAHTGARGNRSHAVGTVCGL